MPAPEIAAYVANLGARAEAIRNKQVSPEKDNFTAERGCPEPATAAPTPAVP